jgi:hypothetical protein
MKIRMVKRPGEVTQIVNDETGEQIEGVTNVQYREDLNGAILTVQLADFAVDVLDDATILNAAEQELKEE